MLCTVADMEALGRVDLSAEPAATTTLLIGAAQATIERYCNRTFNRQADRVDVLDGPGEASLWLPLYPVQAITSVVEDGTTLTADVDYLLYPAQGRLVRLQGSNDRTWWWDYRRRSIVVTYTGGYDDAEAGYEVPDDLRWVCAQVALRLYKAEVAAAATPAGSAGPVTAVALDGVGSQTFAAGGGASRPWEPGAQTSQVGAGSGPALTNSEKQALSGYRRRVLHGGPTMYEGRH